MGWGCDNRCVESCLHLSVSFLRTAYGLLGFHAVTSSWLSDVRIAYECSVPALPIANKYFPLPRRIILPVDFNSLTLLTYIKSTLPSTHNDNGPLPHFTIGVNESMPTEEETEEEEL